MTETAGTTKTARLASLDALRGFDMLFIMGGETLLCAVAAAFGCPELSKTLGHAPWQGLHFMDLVFPLFLFIAGVSFPFSSTKSLSTGMSRGQVALKAFRRGMTLVLLGLVCNRILSFEFATLRVWSVLGRIGLAWMFAAWITLLCGWRMRLALCVVLLASVTAVTLLVPAPGAPSGVDTFSAEGNLGCWLDRTLTAGHTYRPLFDPEGFAGLLPAVVTALLGVFAGEIVKAGGGGATAGKALRLLLAGVALLAAGEAVSRVVPINKALWSPSFTLVAGGISFVVFAAFYWIVDVHGWTRWAFPLKVVGVNSITIYLAQRIVPFGSIRDFFLKGFASLFPADASQIILAAGYVAVCWLFLYFLFRQKTFLRV